MAAEAGGVSATKMLRAAETGDIAAIQDAIDGGIDIMSKDAAKNTVVLPTPIFPCLGCRERWAMEQPKSGLAGQRVLYQTICCVLH